MFFGRNKNSDSIFRNFEIQNTIDMPTRTKDKEGGNENDKRITVSDVSPVIVKKKSVPKSEWPHRYVKVAELLAAIKTNLSDEIINGRGE